MPIVVNCPGCADEVQVPDHLHGVAVLCPRCGLRFAAPDAPPPEPGHPADRKFCVECGAVLRRNAAICPGCGVAQPGMGVPPPLPVPPERPDVPRGTSRVAAGLLAIFFGWLGLHKFLMGYMMEGLIMLLVSVMGFPCLCFRMPFGLTGPSVMMLIGVIEGISYLSKSDVEFYQTYEVKRKGWF